MNSVIKRCIILLFTAFLLAGCGGGGGGGAYIPAREWTYMVYMGADNNLSTAGLVDLNEMEMVGSNSNMAIVVQAEFSPTYTDLTGLTTATRRIYVENDGDPNMPNWNTGTSLGTVDMASPAALTSFITWAKTNYPAQHYALVIWDHGAGWKARKAASPFRGAVQDETSGNFMSLPDLAKGVADSGVHFDIINFDACLMGMYEVAYEFKGLTDYMVFSEETEPGEGDPYDTILAALAANPAMTGSSLAGVIVDKYDAFYVTNDRGSTTKSAIDMSKLDVLDAKLLALAAALKSDGSSATVVTAARATTQEYTYTANHDLWHFSNYLTTSSAGAAVKAAAAEVKTAVSSMVIANKTNPDTSNSHGLAIYLPLDSETNAAELGEYALLACNRTVRASTAGTWGAYIEGLLSGSGGGTASYREGNFGLYLAWTNINDGACNSDLDLYVWEPDATGGGKWYAPFMGQTSLNGFFSQDSADSGRSEEYYLANDQVLAGDYYFLVNYYKNGSSCVRAKARLYFYDPVLYPDLLWHEANQTGLGVSLSYPSPQLLDNTFNAYAGQTLVTLDDLNLYSDWWAPFVLTRSSSLPEFAIGVNLPAMTKNTQMIIRYKKDSRLFGVGR